MNDTILVLDVLKVFGLSSVSFFVALFLTPILTHYLYKYKMWPQRLERESLGGGPAIIIAGLTKDRTHTETPRMGGVLIWGTVLIITVSFWILGKMLGGPLFTKLNYLSREQTWLPIFALASASLIGLADDWLQIRGRGGYIGGGMLLKMRIGLVTLIGAIGAWWFYGPLEHSTLLIPFYGTVHLGIFFIPFFILTMLALFSTGVIDGLDGLAGGVIGSVIAAYGGIAFFQQQLDLAAFLGVIGGALLAFLWYNIPPARFYMGESGILGLTSMLTVVAFLTNAVAVLPIIAFPLVVETLSVIIQIGSKRLRGKKVFIAAPLHHHFEARGWPHYKVTMRFWVVSLVMALVGMVIHIIGK